MIARNISVETIVDILSKGKFIQRDKKNKYWVFKKIKNRQDNRICLSISIEYPFLILITALVNWSPTNEN